jgi:hypothetical protein
VNTATTVCDIGLVGTDNGLYDKMSGESLTFTMGINDFEKFNPHYYDRRLKLHPVTSYADWPNHRFSGNSKTIYNIVSKNAIPLDITMNYMVVFIKDFINFMVMIMKFFLKELIKVGQWRRLLNQDKEKNMKFNHQKFI